MQLKGNISADEWGVRFWVVEQVLALPTQSPPLIPGGHVAGHVSSNWSWAVQLERSFVLSLNWHTMPLSDIQASVAHLHGNSVISGFLQHTSIHCLPYIPLEQCADPVSQRKGVTSCYLFRQRTHLWAVIAEFLISVLLILNADI